MRRRHRKTNRHRCKYTDKDMHSKSYRKKETSIDRGKQRDGEMGIRKTVNQTDTEIDRQIQKQIERQTVRLRQKEREIDRHKGRQMDGQTGRQMAVCSVDESYL